MGLRQISRRATQNEELVGIIEHIHNEAPDKGYRRIRDDLEHDYDVHVNDKRVLLSAGQRIRSTVKYASHSCTRHASNPQYIAENLLDCQSHADKPNEKWLTNVIEFKTTIRWYSKPLIKRSRPTKK